MDIIDRLIFILIGAMVGIWIGGGISYIIGREIVKSNIKLREDLRISQMVARHQASVIGQYGEEFVRLTNEAKNNQ
jgi:membrane protein DedA with SNARE-associated domain